MNYHALYKCDIANGIGWRVTLFVSGCSNHCKGCQNPQTWDPNSGKPFTEEVMTKLLGELKKPYCRGLSLSGGDPLFPGNVEAVREICRRAKAECPDKDIALWTGYVFEDLNREQKSVLQYVDVLIDGPFIQELADPYKLVWRGSSNQRVCKKEDGVWKTDDRYPYVDVCSSSIKADASSTLCRLTREGLQRLPWIFSLIQMWRRIEDVYHTSNFFHKICLFLFFSLRIFIKLINMIIHK